jgi:hypothetical protein
MGQQILTNLLQGNVDPNCRCTTSSFTNRQSLCTLGQNSKDMSVIMKFLERNMSLTGKRNYSLKQLPSGKHKSNNTISERSSNEGWESEPKNRPSNSDFSSSRPAESNRLIIDSHCGNVDGTEKLELSKDDRHGPEESERSLAERFKEIGRSPTFGLRQADTVFLERHMPQTLTRLLAEFTQSEIFRNSNQMSPETQQPQPIMECPIEESMVFGSNIDYGSPVDMATPTLFRAEFQSKENPSKDTPSHSPYTKDSPFTVIDIKRPLQNLVMLFDSQKFPGIDELVLGNSPRWLNDDSPTSIKSDLQFNKKNFLCKELDEESVETPRQARREQGETSI